MRNSKAGKPVISMPKLPLQNARAGLCTSIVKGMTKGVASLTLVLALSACNTLFPQQPPATYEIVAPAKVSGIGGGTSAQILVVAPTALKFLDSQNIVIKPEPTVVEYLAKAQWTDRLPKVVQAKLVETFENTGRAKAVAKPGEGLVIDYQIVSDLRAFEARMDGSTGKAMVEISVKLVSDRTGKVVRTKIFSESVAISSNDNSEIVSGLNEAFDKVSSDIVRWVFKAV